MIWLSLGLNQTLKQSIIWINSARDIWKDLEERYDRGDVYRLSDLLEAFKRAWVQMIIIQI